MAKTYNITVLPHNAFDEYMTDNHINDSNVEGIKDTMFISIIGTKECLKYYLEEEDTKHWFAENHTNVINLDFDDLSMDITWHGHQFKAISEDQAKSLYEFIERNIRDGRGNAIIHCRAGMSRSQAIGRFITAIHPELYGNCEEQGILMEHANKEVLRMLMREHYKKNPPFSDM